MNSSIARRCISAVVVWLLAGGCTPDATTTVVSSDKEVRIAQENYPESRILANILAFLAQSEGFKPLITNDLGEFSEILDRMRKDYGGDDAIDININYMGDVTDSVIVAAAKEDQDSLRDDMNEDEVERWLKDKGILMKRLGFENGYELAMRKDFAIDQRLETCTDLRNKDGGPYRIAMTRAFHENEWKRLQGYLDPNDRKPGKQKFEVMVMDHERSYDALMKNDGDDSVQIMIAYSTDWQLAEDAEFSITLLKDPDNECFRRNYVAVLLYREDFDGKEHESLWKRYECLADADPPSSSFLSDDAIRALNKQMTTGEGSNETLIAAMYVTEMLQQQERSWTVWWTALGAVTVLITITMVMLRRRVPR